MVNKADELLDAAFEGRADEAVEILTVDPSLIQIGDALGDTAFHVAARAGHEATILKMIKLLDIVDLNMLLDVLCQGNAQGDTPLHLAVKNGHKEAAVHLVRTERQAASIMNDDQHTPIDLAQRAGNEELLSLLQNTGGPEYHIAPSDIELRFTRMALSDNEDDDEDEEEWIRLHKAAAQGKHELIVQLLEDDEDIIHYKNETGCTALHVAAFYGQVGSLKKIVEVMESSSEVKRLMLDDDNSKNTPLHYALQGSHEETVRYLVEVAPRAMYKVNSDGVSPLSLAVERGDPGLVGYMTRMRVSKSIRDRLLDHAKKISIAQTAIKKRNLVVLQALMEGLPELINLPDKKGWKLLSFAACKGYLDEVCYILNNFPDSIAKHDEDGSLPIHKAVVGGQLSVVKEFVSRRPQSLQDVDKKGRNILDLATLHQSKDVLSYLSRGN